MGEDCKMSEEWSFKDEMKDSRERHSKVFIASGFCFLGYLRRHPEDAEIMRDAYDEETTK